MRPRSVLIADESLPVRTVLTDILRKLGQPPDTLHVATTQEEVLEAYRSGRPDTVFMEMWIEGKDTLELIEAMFSDNPRLKIVLVTAEARTSPDVREAIRMGVFDYIEKPLRMEKIRNTMSAILEEEGGVERLR